MRMVTPIVANAVLVVAALSLGSVLRRLIPESFSRIDRIAIILLGGLGILGTLLFCIGQVRFSRPAILLALCFCILLGSRSLWREIGEYRSSVVRIPLPVLPVLLVVSVLLVTAIGGPAAPPGDNKDDAVAHPYPRPPGWLRPGINCARPAEGFTLLPLA